MIYLLFLKKLKKLMINIKKNFIYKRVILKISGEALKLDKYTNKKKNNIIDHEILINLCHNIKKLNKNNVQIGIVIGGGNIYRGNNQYKTFSRSTGDLMGMLSTVINGIALMDCLEEIGVSSVLQSAIPLQSIAEPFIAKKAINHMKKNRVVIFVAGLGNSNFSTDTTAALRAIELDANIILKITKVDGIYTQDPIIYKDAKLYEKISFKEILEKKIKIMDYTAFSFCFDHKIPIIVFNINIKNGITKAILGEKIGTLVI